MRNLLTLADVTAQEIHRIFALSGDLKQKYQAGVREPLLPGRVMALLFEKQSLRTRVSFQSGMAHLGGSSLMLGDDAGFGKRESVADFVRVLSEMVDVIVVRTKRHATAEEVARHSACCVINGLTDQSHPCQALADLYTIREHAGTLAGAKIAWVGDANNVARSLAHGSALLGVEFVVATPVGYDFDPGFLEGILKQTPDAKVRVTHDAAEAVEGATAVYTDVWASMGQEGEREQRRRDFARFQVNSELMRTAGAQSLFMHCLPARRGEEVVDEVIDGAQSIVVEQAANRMHVQKGVLAWLLGAHS